MWFRSAVTRVIDRDLKRYLFPYWKACDVRVWCDVQVEEMAPRRGAGTLIPDISASSALKSFSLSSRLGFDNLVPSFRVLQMFSMETAGEIWDWQILGKSLVIGAYFSSDISVSKLNDEECELDKFKVITFLCSGLKNSATDSLLTGSSKGFLLRS